MDNYSVAGELSLVNLDMEFEVLYDDVCNT